MTLSRDVCQATWLPVKLCGCPAHEGSVCWKCDKRFTAGTCITCEICGGQFCEECQNDSCDEDEGAHPLGRHEANVAQFKELYTELVRLGLGRSPNSIRQGKGSA